MCEHDTTGTTRPSGGTGATSTTDATQRAGGTCDTQYKGTRTTDDATSTDEGDPGTSTTGTAVGATDACPRSAGDADATNPRTDGTEPSDTDATCPDGRTTGTSRRSRGEGAAGEHPGEKGRVDESCRTRGDDVPDIAVSIFAFTLLRGEAPGDLSKGQTKEELQKVMEYKKPGTSTNTGILRGIK